MQAQRDEVAARLARGEFSGQQSDEAIAYVQRINRISANADMVVRAIKEIVKGIAAIVLGLLITGGTYLLADGGGKYLVTWGIVLYGVINLVRGITMRRNAMNALDNP